MKRGPFQAAPMVEFFVRVPSPWPNKEFRQLGRMTQISDLPPPPTSERFGMAPLTEGYSVGQHFFRPPDFIPSGISQ